MPGSQLRIKLIHVDGKIPNLALMKLSSFYKAQGSKVLFSRSMERDLFDGDLERVTASSIFKFSEPAHRRLRQSYPEVVLCGTGTDTVRTVEDEIGQPWERYDYSIYPGFTASIGFTQRGCRLTCGFCLMPGALIVTGNGLRPIEEITIGDMVLTHKGQYRRVIATMSRSYSGKVISFDSGAISRMFPASITPEHPAWTRHVSYRSGGQRLTSFAWRDAGRIKPGNQHRSRDVFAYPRTAQTVIPADVDGFSPTSAFMALLGWYLAEGYVTQSPGRGYHRTTFCLGFSQREARFGEQIVALAAQCGLKASAHKPKIGIRVVIESVRFARWLISQFGTGAGDKKVPLWVRLLPAELLVPMIDAWTDGDGWRHPKRQASRVTTVSINLAAGLRELALKCGYNATINLHQMSNVIMGRKVNCKQGYTVVFHRPSPVKRSVISDQANVYSAVREVRDSQHNGLVYNLEVDEDNSYCTPAFALHNCVVPKKEGRPKSVNTIGDIWRGEGHPKHLHLLDNDFFGQPREQWRDRVREIIDGGFKICLNQGINARLIDEEAAAALASIPYYDDQFKMRRLYTAWDNIGDEAIFFRGVEMLQKAGIPPRHLMTYMLIGYDKRETWEAILYRFSKMHALGINVHPMVYDNKRKDLKWFQRWVLRKYYQFIPWEKFTKEGRREYERAARAGQEPSGLSMNLAEATDPPAI